MIEIQECSNSEIPNCVLNIRKNLFGSEISVVDKDLDVVYLWTINSYGKVIAGQCLELTKFQQMEMQK